MIRKFAQILLLALVFFSGALVHSQDKKQKAAPTAAPAPPPEFKIPPEDAKRENPVKPTPSSIAEGKSMYTTQCAMCHGKEGDGKGDLAVDMKLNMKDYRNPDALKGMTDGELFYILKKGKGDMPSEEGRMKSEQLWNLINYIHSFAKSKPADR